MRIAYLTQSYPPMISGAAILVERLAKAMAGRGHQVLVIAASDQNDSYKTDQENLSVLRLRSIHNPLRVGQRFLLYPRSETLQELRNFYPDIIHSHEPLLLGKLGLEHACSVQIPILLTVHQGPWFVSRYLPNIPALRPMIEAILWAYARRLLQQFNGVIAPSQTIAGLVKTMTGIQPRVVSNGIALQKFRSSIPCEADISLRRKLHIPADVPVILHVGRLDADKNVERVIVAAAGAMQNTGAHLLIVGDGSQKHTLMKMCESLNLAGRVHFPGYITLQDGLPEIYRLASLFITTSEIEVQSLVLLEAIASALPIIAVRATFVPEVVHDGINGFLTEPGDISALTRGILTLLNDPAASVQMGKRSRMIAEQHDIDCSIDLHEQLYAGFVKQTRMEPVLRRTARKSQRSHLRGRTATIRR